MTRSSPRPRPIQAALRPPESHRKAPSEPGCHFIGHVSSQLITTREIIYRLDRTNALFHQPRPGCTASSSAPAWGWPRLRDPLCVSGSVSVGCETATPTRLSTRSMLCTEAKRTTSSARGSVTTSSLMRMPCPVRHRALFLHPWLRTDARSL